MSPAELLNGLGTIGDAPEGIERLRGIVLSLAMSGRLDTARESDESSDKLLEQIKYVIACGERGTRRNSSPNELE